MHPDAVAFVGMIVHVTRRFGIVQLKQESVAHDPKLATIQAGAV